MVEGRRELEHCLEAGYTVRTIFYCPEIIGGLTEEGVVSQISGHPRPDKREGPAGEASGRGRSEAEAICDTIPSGVEPFVIEIPEQLYRKVAYRESTEGIIAEVEYKSLKLSDLKLPENPLVMVLESVEKPGNLGAVLRSADAAGVDAVIFCDPLTDLYNPNLIRASIGAVFTVPTVAASSEETIAFLKERGIQILTAQLQDSSLYYDIDMRRGTALVMGTEATGLTDLWRKAASAHIRIPMLGRLDSLNVSVSAAILLFEAVRQRQ
ncbi:MAG: RNA methyltransferase [Bacteroidales bacterium]|nr:RNA methyltransferase [Bacteroidales bacterium]